jgi:nucleoside-diphosphate-sugar epimerase
LFKLFEAFCAASGLSGVWARPFFLFGPHESPERLVSSVITSLLRDEPARCTHGRQIRDYLYSREAADALVHLLSTEFEGAVNVASGSGVSVADVVQLIAGRVGREDLVELGALAEPEGEAPRVVADIGRLRAEAGWRPAVGLEQGLDETIDWWRRELNL